MIKQLQIIFLVLLCFPAAFAQKGTGAEQQSPLAYNLNMVHHNPGETPFDTKYNDPFYLKKAGFNGQIPRVFLPCAITYDSFDGDVMPKGSALRKATEVYAAKIDSMLAAAKKAGIPVYPFTDLLVIPKAIQTKYGKEMQSAEEGDMVFVEGGARLQASILRPRTEEVLRAQIREIFDRFPDLGGLTTRFGETYLHEFPEYAGGSPALSPQEHIRLINILRDEICVKRNKKLFYRTWCFNGFHNNPAYYLEVTDAIEPHPNLCFSIKNTLGDYIRLTPFNPCLGIGKHRQIVEVSCNYGGLYGKNTHPFYLGQGIINGWEEYAWIKNDGPARCLRDLLKCPQFAGVWTWARGDGWKGPYLADEMWVDLNEQVFSLFAREPWRSEKELFDKAAAVVFGITGKNLEKMRRLCLLSADAVVRAHLSLHTDVDVWWCRDQYLTAIDLKGVVRAGKQKQVREEKEEAVRMWKEMEQLSREIRLPNIAQQDYIEVSVTYGRIKTEIIRQIWLMQLLAAEAEVNSVPLQKAAMKQAIAEYERLWNEWRALKAAHACCPTLYTDTTAQYIDTPPFRKVLDTYKQAVLDESNQVEPVVNWNAIVGKLTSGHWGLNTQKGEGFTTPFEEKADFYRQVKPGVLRVMSHLTYGWVKEHSWDTLRIKTQLDNARHLYQHSERIMLCLYSPPPFINSGKLPLANEMQEDSLATFFAQLPSVIKATGHRIDLYEFFNEAEPRFGALGGNSGNLSGTGANLPTYWRTLNKIAKAIKTADPTAKVGGPATAFPYENVYKGFMDNCADNMDFFSFHLYLTGHPGTTPDADLFNNFYASRTDAVKELTDYVKSKGKTHLELYQDEWQVSYEWKKYEPLHDNHVGASWMACYIKDCALKGITNMNVWDYGFHPHAATFLLYSRFSPYLRGNVAQSNNTGGKIEIIPVISDKGKRSVLLINKTGGKIEVLGAGKLLGGKASAVKGFRLDATTLQNPEATNTENVKYAVERIANLPSDITLNPYGMALLTNYEIKN
ncbi:MAG: hypothetical protein LBR34_09830 [Prevotella sp.]|nr:hypothetical protein [Prevotella sp.]